MDIESLRDYCLHKPHVTEGFPFDESTLVFKVADKMFALTGLDKQPPSVNLKCDPEKSLDLQEEYWQITPGYHMSKKHWITVAFNELPSDIVKELIDASYSLVVSGLKKKKRATLGL